MNYSWPHFNFPHFSCITHLAYLIHRILSLLLHSPLAHPPCHPLYLLFLTHSYCPTSPAISLFLIPHISCPIFPYFCLPVSCLIPLAFSCFTSVLLCLITRPSCLCPPYLRLAFPGLPLTLLFDISSSPPFASHSIRLLLSLGCIFLWQTW